MISEKKNGRLLALKFDDERKKKLKFEQNIILIISKVRRKVKKSCKGKKLKEKVKSIKEKLKLKKSCEKKSQKVTLIYIFRY